MENHITKNHITHKHTHTHTYIPNELSQIAICLFFIELIALNWLHWNSFETKRVPPFDSTYLKIFNILWLKYYYYMFFIWNINSANVIKTSKIPFSFSSVIEWTLCLTAKPNSSYDNQRYFFIFLVKISNTSNIFITLCILTLALT